MKIGIIGAGFFGIAAAIKLKEKFKDSTIHIFDKKVKFYLDQVVKSIQMA